MLALHQYMPLLVITPVCAPLCPLQPQRLAQRQAKDPARYKRLFTIVQDEVVEKTNTDNSSCTKGLLWLKR